MPEGTVLTAITAIVGALATVVTVLWKKSETRWEATVADLKAAHAAALAAQDRTIERMAKQYEDQLETALADTRDYKDMLRTALQSGNKAVEVGVEQARRLSNGAR